MTPSQQNKKKGKWGPLGGILAFLALLGGKLKFLLPLLKLGKIGGTFWSMALMVGAYAIIYPWSFAIGIVAMIFIHEMGHVLAARQKGIAVSAPAFIPFLGALITVKKNPADAATEAYIAMGGPLVGTIGAAAVFAVGAALDSPALYSVAQVGFFLNLINLIPIHPLDGGRIVTAVTRWLWLVGLIGGLVLILYLRAIIFLILWALFAWELYKKYVRKKRAEDQLIERNLTIKVRKDFFQEAGVPVPAESHTRLLPFRQYCSLQTREELLQINYPGAGRLALLPFQTGLVGSVRLLGTKAAGGEAELTVLITFLVYPEYQSTLFQKEEYYEVPAKVRWTYGLSYFALAAFLALMMYQTHSLLQFVPLAG